MKPRLRSNVLRRIGERYGERASAIGESGRIRRGREEDRVEETWHRGMQLHNAAGPPPTPTSYYYSTHVDPTGLGPATRMWTRLFDRVDFSSSIALASITGKQTRFNAGLNVCFMDGLIYRCARIMDLWIYESRMRSRCHYRVLFLILWMRYCATVPRKRKTTIFFFCICFLFTLRTEMCVMYTLRIRSRRRVRRPDTRFVIFTIFFLAQRSVKFRKECYALFV